MEGREERKKRERRAHFTWCEAIREGGFTLVELLVSVTVLVIIGGVAYTVFNSSIDIYYKSESRIVMAQKCRVGLDFLSKDLSNMYVVEGDESLILVSQDNPSETGERDVISFVTIIHTDPDPFLAQLNQEAQTGLASEQIPPVSDVQRVAYYIGPDLAQREDGSEVQTTVSTGDEADDENLVLSRITTTSIDPETVIGPLFDTGTLPTEDEDGNPIYADVAQLIDRVASFDLKYSDGEEWYESWEDSETIPKSVQVLITVSTEDSGQRRQNVAPNTMTHSTMVYLPMSANFGEQAPGGG